MTSQLIPAPAIAHDLATAIAHDVKNRVAVLAQELLCIEQSVSDPKVQHHINNAKAQSGAVLRSLTNFLVGNQINAGALCCRSEPESVEELLAEVAERARVFLPSHVSLEVPACEAPDVWFLDRTLVQLALDTGLDNAARYAHSRVQLYAKRGTQGIVFVVKNDSSSDVASSHLPVSSTGLGLKIAKAIAAAHRNKGLNGSVRLELNEDETVFAMMLP